MRAASVVSLLVLPVPVAVVLPPDTCPLLRAVPSMVIPLVTSSCGDEGSELEVAVEGSDARGMLVGSGS